MINTKLPLYGITLLLALIVNIIISTIIIKKYKYKNIEILSLLIYENIGIILGAKTLTYIENYKEVSFDLLRLGLSSYGAVIGAILFIMLFSYQFKKSLKELVLIFMPTIPLMYAIGKIGCFLAGCCHGIEYSGIGHVIYNYSSVAPTGLKLFPIQIVETLVFTLISIYMIKKSFKNKFNIKTLGISFILCGLSKFLLEFFRMSHLGKIISFTQTISILFIVIGIVIIIFNKKSLGEVKNGIKK